MSTASVELALVPSAECSELATSGLDSQMPGPMIAFTLDSTPEPLGYTWPGEIGLYARARDAQCRVIAAGCATYTVAARGTGDLDVPLGPVARGCVCAGCNAGRCPLAPPPNAHPPGVALYDHGVAAMFQNESYDAGGTDGHGTVCDASRSVSPPCSFGLNASPYGAVRIATADHAAFPVAGIDVLEFAIHTDGNPIDGFKAILFNFVDVTATQPTHYLTEAVGLSPNLVTATRADGWAHVVIDLAQLDPTGAPLAGAEIQSNLGTPQTAHIDNVRLGARPCRPPW
jgi:hypothetical protein